jgi:hypothetical protein
MGGRRQSHHQETRMGVPETWDRLSPILFLGVGCPLGSGHLFTPINKARTSTAFDDLGLDLGQGRTGGKAHQKAREVMR